MSGPLKINTSDSRQDSIADRFADRSLSSSHIFRIFSRQREFRKSERIGTVRGGFSGGNQLVSCCNRIVNYRCEFNKQIFSQFRHSRPIGDIWAENQLCILVRISETVVKTVLICGIVKCICIF